MLIGIDRYLIMDVFSIDDLKFLLVIVLCVCIYGMEMVLNFGFVGLIYVFKFVFGF